MTINTLKRNRLKRNIFLLALSSIALTSYIYQQQGEQMLSNDTDIHYTITATSEILVTSEAGDKIAHQENLLFKEGKPSGTVITIRPDIVKQTLTGIGTSFTESSAFVLAHLTDEKRAEVMENIYGEQGANFSLARTPIGATDFSVKGK